MGVNFVKYFKVKNGVFCIFKVNECRIPAVFPQFRYMTGGMEGLFDFFDSLHHHPQDGPGTPLAHQAVLEPPSRSLALSKCRHGASDYSRGMM